MNPRHHFNNDRFLIRFCNPVMRALVIGVAFMVVSLAAAATPAASQEPGAYWHEARSIDAAGLNLSRLEALVFDPTTNQFLLFGRSSSAAAGPMSITRLNMAGDVLESTPAAISARAALNVAVDPIAGELFAIDPAAFGLREPRGIAVDAANSRLFVLDAGGLAVAPLRALNGETMDGVVAPEEVQRLPIDAATGNLRGIAYNPANEHLYVVAPDLGRIYELTTDARIVGYLDIAELGFDDPRNLAIAPSGDPTDDPAVMSLYVADRGPAGAGSGRVVELYLVDQRGMAAVAASLPVEIRTSQTSTWSPPSPDPSGIDYSPKLKRLLISDGEVEEMSIFRGKNLFLTNTSGVLKQSCNLTAFTTEPVGVAVNPDDGTVFISDDNADAVFVIRMGRDNKLCTSDDIRTSFSTRAFDDFDPEGVAFGQGLLFVSGGEAAEVYVIGPGNNGTFDGVPPGGDDVLVQQFDTAVLGIRDPEGIGYHPQRGSLFIASRLERRSLFEVSIDGVLLNTFDISAANAILPAGVGIGPASKSPAGMSVYIVDRGIDNGQDPNENDGKLYEVTLGGAPPSPTGNPLYLSHAANTSTVFSGLSQTGDEDILYFDGLNWSMYFDGSDVGLTKADLNAFVIVDANTLLMSFMQPVTIAGLGKVDDSDILQFNATSLGDTTAGSFSLYFDGSDVGLTNASEDIDALDLLPDGRLLISTVGAYAVTGAKGKGDDVLSFTPSSLGATTSGTWALYFDGSDVGIKPKTNIDGISVAAGGQIFLTTANNFSLSGQSIGDEDVFVCTPIGLGASTSCNFASALYFDGSNWGLAADDIDAIQIP